MKNDSPPTGIIETEIAWALADLFRKRVVRYQIFFENDSFENIVKKSPQEDWRFKIATQLDGRNQRLLDVSV